MQLTKYEQETIVTFNVEEPTANVYTCSRKVINTCKRRGYTLISEDDVSKTYECPKSCISFRAVPTRATRPLSPARLEKLRLARESKAV
jgi:hypothetical protein